MSGKEKISKTEFDGLIALASACLSNQHLTEIVSKLHSPCTDGFDEALADAAASMSCRVMGKFEDFFDMSALEVGLTTVRPETLTEQDMLAIESRFYEKTNDHLEEQQDGLYPDIPWGKTA